MLEDKFEKAAFGGEQAKERSTPIAVECMCGPFSTSSLFAL